MAGFWLPQHPWSHALNQGVVGLKTLFGPSDSGFMFDGIRAAIIGQNSDGSGVVSADNDPVGYVADQSGKGNHATQPLVGTKRPYWHPNAGKPYIQGDGVDDYLATTWVPTSAGMLAAAFRTNDAGGIFLGCKGPLNNRAYLGMAYSFAASGGVGENAIGTIVGTSTITNADTVLILAWSGSVVTMWVNGNIEYTAAQNGSVSPGNGVVLCAINNGGTVGSSTARLYAAMGLSRVPNAAEVTKITNVFKRTFQ